MATVAEGVTVTGEDTAEVIGVEVTDSDKSIWQIIWN